MCDIGPVSQTRSWRLNLDSCYLGEVQQITVLTHGRAALGSLVHQRHLLPCWHRPLLSSDWTYLKIVCFTHV